MRNWKLNSKQIVCLECIATETVFQVMFVCSKYKVRESEKESKSKIH